MVSSFNKPSEISIIDPDLEGTNLSSKLTSNPDTEENRTVSWLLNLCHFKIQGWFYLHVGKNDMRPKDQRRNLLNVLDFLKRPNASTLVSGTRDRVNLHDKFKNAIEVSFPGTNDELVLKVEEKAVQQRKLSFWESVADTKVGAFKFSF